MAVPFWKICFRALLVVVGAAVVGLLFNLISPRGLSIFREPQLVSRWKHLSAQEAYALWGKVTFVDSRSKEDFRAGHIKDAINLPVYEFESHQMQFIAAVIPETDLVIYCAGGDCEQSHQLAERLEQAGYRKISILADGLLGWRSKGFPVATGE